MWEFLFSPIDPARIHDVSFAEAWHGRFMVLAWGFIAPLAILIARFFKIMPRQDWPRELDSHVWWRGHWIGQTTAIILTGVAVFLVFQGDLSRMSWHGWLGYGVVLGVAVQVVLGALRGSKGGPTALAADGSLHGHHYDMTRWRRIFEALHKGIGYGVLLLAAVTVFFGMWRANAPLWMWLMLAVWWNLLIIAFVVMQNRGMAIDTYQAIWGNDPDLPGNRARGSGWGTRRGGGDNRPGERSDRHPL